ncbi:MAG: hypothetical protein QOJ09_1721 [Actinomycetota bacterium]|nr:hypothetical protein [Actinomycetota bacterium]
MSSVPSRGDLYDWEQRHVIGRAAQDLPFYASLIRKGSFVLELGCGTGRLAAPLAGAGADVVGLDADLAMLRTARAIDGALLLVQGDMRRFAFGRPFDVVLAAYNCLQLLATAADREACVRSVARHLSSTGVFALEVHDFFGQGAGDDVPPERLCTGPLGNATVTLHGGLRHDRGRRVTTYTRRFEIVTSGRDTQWVDDDVALYSFVPGELGDLLGRAGLQGHSEQVGPDVERWTAQLACAP